MLGALALLAAAPACGDDDDPEPAATPAAIGPCDWPMWGYDAARSFATPCPTEITAATAPRLTLDWTFETRDVVTASPAVAAGTVFVGDWSGRFYALDVETGEERWAVDFEPHPTVYSGQIVSSAAVAVDGEGDDAGLTVVVGAGRTLYALDAATGEERWRHDVHPEGGPDDPSEIQSSPVVADGLVIFGYDGHDTVGVRAGVRALDLSTGELRWWFDPDEGRDATGCAGVWGSPTVDLTRRLVFFGTANCVTSPDGWSEFSEAIVALDLDSGEVRWTFQPHPPSNDDYDFAGAPNLFTVGGVDAVGLGNKDGHYYAVDRETGELLWDVAAAPARVVRRNFSTGGFIGGTALAGDVIVGGTAIGGDCPCLHGIGTDGTLRWQQPAAGPTFASAAAAGDVAFVGSTTDFTLRAVRVADGEILWSETMPGAVAGGPAIAGDRLVAVSGIREPGTEPSPSSAGVSAFVVGPEGGSTTTTAGGDDTLPPTTEAPPPGEPITVPGDDRPCVAAACDVPFTLKEPPAGTSPTVTVHVRPDPFRLEVRTEGLGPPEAWIRAGSPAVEVGAVAYGVFLSVSDDQPAGALLCVLDGAGDCVTEALPQPVAASYNRLSILAIADSTALPEPAEGFDRMVTTQEFTPPLELR